MTEVSHPAIRGSSAHVGICRSGTYRWGRSLVDVVQPGPGVATIEPVVRVELERVEALELLGMTLAHLNDAEARAELSPRIALLMGIRDKSASALREAT